MATDKQEKSDDIPWHPLVVDHGFYSPLISGSIDGTDKVPHDKAIRRALKSTCMSVNKIILVKIFIFVINNNSTDRPISDVKGNSENTIFVARLSHRTTQGKI